MISPYVAPGLIKQSQTITNLVDDVIEIACRVWCITEEQLFSSRHTQRFCQARQFCMWYLDEKTNMGMKKVGKIFSKHHTTVIHARYRIESLRDDDEFMLKVVEAMKYVYAPTPVRMWKRTPRPRTRRGIVQLQPEIVAKGLPLFGTGF
jgi:hypothetical protein